jgi:hypothetical protein
MVRHSLFLLGLAASLQPPPPAAASPAPRVVDGVAGSRRARQLHVPTRVGKQADAADGPLLAAAVTHPGGWHTVAPADIQRSESETTTFDKPAIVGSSNHTHFYFPSVAIPVGNSSAVALHVTLCDDASSCSGNCANTWVSSSRGASGSWTLANTVHHGGSGNFNYYGDLGELVPGSARSSGAAHSFTTLVGNNGGSWMGDDRPPALQAWRYESHRAGGGGGLQLTGATNATIRGTPAAFTAPAGCGPTNAACGLCQGGKIVRVPGDHSLLASFGGFAADGYRNCTPGYKWGQCYTLAFYRSAGMCFPRFLDPVVSVEPCRLVLCLIR